MACDSKSSVALLYQPSSRQAVLVRSGDAITGVIGLSKSELTTRARASVAIELVLDSPRLQQVALAQQFVCKHTDIATLHHNVAVSFGDMDAKAQVLGDNKCDLRVVELVMYSGYDLTLCFAQGNCFSCW